MWKSYFLTQNSLRMPQPLRLKTGMITEIIHANHKLASVSKVHYDIIIWTI